MRKITILQIILHLTFAFFSISLNSQNLLTNGNFETTGGYQSNYSMTSPSGNSNAGDYAITTNSQPVNTANFISSTDHTTGSGKMMVVDGRNSDIFWKQNPNIALQGGSSYLFSYYIKNINSSAANQPRILFTPADQCDTACGTSVTLVDGNSDVGLMPAGWQKVSYRFTPTGPGPKFIRIELSTKNAGLAGHDFALDDLSLSLLPPCPTTAPGVTTPLYLCQGSSSSPLTATPDPGNTLVWYTVASGGVPSIVAPTPSTASSGTTNYYVSQSNGVCEGPRALIKVIVNSYTGNYGLGCDPSAVTQPNSVYFNWDNLPAPILHNYVVTYSINGGPVVTINTNLSHWEVYGVQPGQSVFLTIVSNENTPCIQPQSFTCSLPCGTSTTTPVFASVPASICSGSTAPLLPATSDNGISGTWSPATVDNMNSGSYVFTPGAAFPCAIPITKNITVGPNAGTLSGTQTVCEGSNTQFFSTSPGGTWVSSNLSVATVNINSGVITGIGPGTAIMTYSVAGAPPCSNATKIRQVTVTAGPSAGTLNGNQNICAGGIPTVFASSVPGGTWTSSNLAIATVNNTTGAVSGIAVGTATITYTVTAPNGCTGTATRTVTVSSVPNAGVLSGNQSLCASPGQTVTFSSTVSGGTWTSSNITIASIHPTSGVITGVTAGLATITYTIAGTGGCGNGTATRSITITAPPNAGTVSGNQTLCEGNTTTFTSNIPGGVWSSNVTSVATVNAAGLVTGVAPGTAVIRYTAVGTGGCPDNIATRSITITARQVPTFNPVAPICEGAALAPLPTTSTNGFAGTWSPPLNNMATTVYTFTPGANSCATTTTLTINVRPKLTPVFSLIPIQCVNDPAVPVLPSVSQNGISGTWTPATVSLAVAGTQTYTFQPNANECVTAGPFTLSVTVVANIVPNFQPIAPFCYGKPNLPTLDTTSPNGVEGTWNPPVISNTASASYVFTPNTIVNQCAAQQTLVITVIPKTQPNFPAVPFFCVNTTAPILTNVSPNGVNGTWAPAVVDNTVVGTSNYIFTPDPGECALTQTLPITVTPGIVPNFADVAICITDTPPILNSVSPNGVNGTWTPVAIDMSLIGTNPYLFTPLPGECGVPQTINVTINEYRLNQIEGIVSNYFEDLQVITVVASNSGNYLYQLDYGPLQESNVFTDVPAGLHTITVVDANNCGPSLSDPNILVINFPKFFTPNNDNYNDTWNISGLKDQNATITIFDRYGKLIKQISPHGVGWDGRYNDVELPSSDYWFTVDYIENDISKQFKSHFSLKR